MTETTKHTFLSFNNQKIYTYNYLLIGGIQHTRGPVSEHSSINKFKLVLFPLIPDVTSVSTFGIVNGCNYLLSVMMKKSFWSKTELRIS